MLFFTAALSPSQKDHHNDDGDGVERECSGGSSLAAL